MGNLVGKAVLTYSQLDLPGSNLPTRPLGDLSCQRAYVIPIAGALMGTGKDYDTR